MKRLTLLEQERRRGSAQNWERVVAGLRPGWQWFYQTEPGNGAPTAEQMEFFEAGEHEVLFGGATGTGKTMAALWKLADYAVRYPGISMVAGRKHASHVAANIYKKATRYWKALYDATGIRVVVKKVPSATRWVATFPNGSTVQMLGFDDPESYQGDDWNIVWVDESAHIDEAAHKQIADRLRGDSFGADDPRSRYPRQKLYTSNYGHGYVHDRLAVPGLAGELEGSKRFIEADLVSMVKYEKEAALTGQPSYIDTLRSDGLHSEAEIRGYAAPSGTVWRALVETGVLRDVIHEEEFLDPGGEWGGPVKGTETVYFGMDHGIGNPTAIMFGVLRQHAIRGTVLVIFNEWYEPLKDRTYPFLAGVMKERFYPALSHMGWWDTAMKHGEGQIRDAMKRGLEGLTDPRTELRGLGINGHNAVKRLDTTIAAVAQVLMCHRLVFVRQRTENVRREIAGYMKAGSEARPGEDASLPMRGTKRNHACDGTRYLVSGLVAYRLLVPEMGLSALVSAGEEAEEPEVRVDTRGAGVEERAEAHRRPAGLMPHHREFLNGGGRWQASHR